MNSSSVLDLGPSFWRTWRLRKDQIIWRSRWSYFEELLILSNQVRLEIEIKAAVQDGSWLELGDAWPASSTNNCLWIRNPGLQTLFHLRSLRFRPLYQGIRGGGTPAGALALAEARRRLMITALAVERYRLVHQDLPGSLSALVPVFVAAVPLDPSMSSHCDTVPRQMEITCFGPRAQTEPTTAASSPSGALSGIEPDFKNTDLVWPAPILELTKPN